MGWTKPKVVEPMEQRERMVINNEYADSTSCVPVLFPFCTIVLATGMIWRRASLGH